MVDRKKTIKSLILGVLFSFIATGHLKADATLDAKAKAGHQIAGERLFALYVKPILVEKCFACHGEEGKKIKGELNMTSLEGLLKGGESLDDVLVPGKAEKSWLYKSIRWEDPDYEMPPKENDRLSEAQIARIRDWINLGAPWPDAARQKKYQLAERNKKETAEGLLWKTSGGTSESWTYRRYKKEDLWAFQPVKKPATSLDGHPVDYFHLKKLSELGIQAAEQTDKRALIKRATFDLWGLPPTPEAVDAFIHDDAPDAYERLIDRLLESPRYGERWAQHWLDVARYADTAGLSNDYERSNMWRYRDYVIRSLNEDKPYDQFIKEQLAGDEIDPKDPEKVIATSFLRMGAWDTAMVMPDEARQIYLDDLVNITGQTFLATTMRCLKCHDHKFDPHPTRDYYRLYAAFAGTQPAEIKAPFLKEENTNHFDHEKKLVEELLDYATDKHKQIVEIRETAARKWYNKNNKPYLNSEARKKLPDDQKPPRHVGLDHILQGRLKVRAQDMWIWQRRLERFEPYVQTVYNGPDRRVNTRKIRKPGKLDMNWRPRNFILSGGGLTAQADPVTPGVLSAIQLPTNVSRQQKAESAKDDPYALPDSLTGRRLALAEWIADPNNPLTTRSIVNRIWQGHFGTGIVKTSNNFGVIGEKPTHPELLDWLAATFVEQGWSFKKLHKVIMTSKAYQMKSAHPNMTKVEEIDPNGRYLAHFYPRRLSAEEIRDSLLAVTGELNLEMGGLPVRPEINMEVALQPRMIQFSLAPAYLPSSTSAQRNRRTIYTYRVRGLADPFLEIFNRPTPNDATENRNHSSVSPQAFTLLNSELISDRAIAFALRLEKEVQAPLASEVQASLASEAQAPLALEVQAPLALEAQIKRAIELAFARPATDHEIKRLVSYVQKMQTYHKQHQPQKQDYPLEITRSLVEEFSGQPFSYKEILNVFKNYEADAKPWDVSADTRALADLCLLLFNSNEFMFLY